MRVGDSSTGLGVYSPLSRFSRSEIESSTGEGSSSCIEIMDLASLSIGLEREVMMDVDVDVDVVFCIVFMFVTIKKDKK